jgi:amidase
VSPASYARPYADNQFTISLLQSQNTTGYDAAYYQALAFNHELGRTRGIDYALKKYKLDALVLPSGGYTVSHTIIYV